MLENPTRNTRVEDGRDMPLPASTAWAREHVALERHAHELGPGLALRTRLGLCRRRVWQTYGPSVAHDLGAELGVGCEHARVEHQVELRPVAHAAGRVATQRRCQVGKLAEQGPRLARVDDLFDQE